MRIMIVDRILNCLLGGAAFQFVVYFAQESAKMPVLFIGHGSPMNAVEDNKFSKGWKEIAKLIPQPAAVLCISAHWVTKGSYVTGAPEPKTIHDFMGFPDALYKVNYKAKGVPKLALEVSKLVKAVNMEIDTARGLDHGAWSFLRQMYPNADIPVLELSLNSKLALDKHYQIGKELSALRQQGILIAGSGNVVHNLMAADPDMYDPYPWAVEFDDFVKERIMETDHNALLGYLENPMAKQAHPSNEHYLPLLYALGAAGNGRPEFFNEEFSLGSLSMRCVVFAG